MRQLPLKYLLLMIGMIGTLPLAVYAEGPNDAQRLASFKQIRQQGIEARLNILQQERACVQAAPTMEALHSCEQASRQMIEKMHEQQKASWESLKAANQQNKENKN